MSKCYINWKSRHGLETIDEFEKEPTQSEWDFLQYCRKMVSEYRMAYGEGRVYRSSRSTKEWRDR